ncbi:MAG: undecaprenyl-phosphate glucose phosphotransferase [Methanobacteriaceae archaeon]|nr:undecaprenyl-phosphate glucose phosphotransferase [Methanobacteriaceae archaeon]
MIRENQKVFNSVNVLLDMLVILVSLFIITSSFFSKIFKFNLVIDFRNTVLIFMFLIPSYILLYSVFELYAPQRAIKSMFSETFKIMEVNLIEFFLLTMTISIGAIAITSPGFIAVLIIVNTCLASIERFLLRLILRYLRAKGFNIKYILIIGAGEVGVKLFNTIKKNTYLGYKVIGFLDDDIEGELEEGVKVIGKIKDLDKIYAEQIVDRVIISISPRHFELLQNIIDNCEKIGVRAEIIPDYYRYVTSHPNIESIDDIPIISVRRIPLDISYNHYIKRIFDIIFVSTAFIIFSPLLIIIALLVKLTSKGPIIYSQERVGKDGEIFKIYKFRSMYTENSYIDEEKWTQKDDPRITPIGKFIRKTSIDELPQFYNILKGNMSLVGPRPERPYFVDKFKESIPRYMIKHHVQPGMTGLAQINGYRGNTSIKKRIKFDIEYVENWGILLDLKIIIKTIPTLIKDQNAY